MELETHRSCKISVETDEYNSLEDLCMDADGENPYVTYRKASRYVLGNHPVNDDWEPPDRETHHIYPVYAYVHSGVAIRATTGGNPFGCPWDSGLSGVVYISKEKVAHLTTGQVREYLFGFVENLSAALSGDVYSLIISYPTNNNETDPAEEYDDVYQGGVYIGSNWEENGLLSDAKEAIQAHWEGLAEEKEQQNKEAASHGVPV